MSEFMVKSAAMAAANAGSVIDESTYAALPTHEAALEAADLHAAKLLLADTLTTAVSRPQRAGADLFHALHKAVRHGQPGVLRAFLHEADPTTLHPDTLIPTLANLRRFIQAMDPSIQTAWTALAQRALKHAERPEFNYTPDDLTAARRLLA